MKPHKKRLVLPYLLVTPALLLLAAFMLYPMLSNLAISLFQYKLTSTKRPFVGLANYAAIIQESRIWAAMGRTVLWTAVNLALIVLLGLILAMLLNTRFPGSGFLKAFMLVPWILPSVITGYIWQLMLAEDAGIVTYAMKALKLVEPDFSWFASRTGRPKPEAPTIQMIWFASGGTSMAAAIMANSWRAFPFVALLVYARLSNQSRDQVEAAVIDGAGRWQVFRYVTLPHIRPVLSNCTLLIFIWTFNAYDIMRGMTNGGPAEKTTTMSIIVYKEAFNYYSISNAATISVLMFSIMLSIILVVRLIRNAFFAGGED